MLATSIELVGVIQLSQYLLDLETQNIAVFSRKSNKGFNI